MNAHSPIPSSPSARSVRTRAAHGILYRTHAPALRAFAKSVLGYAGDPEDAVQEAFANAWTLAAARPGLPPPPLGWLREEVRRIALETRHRAAREEVRHLRAW